MLEQFRLNACKCKLMLITWRRNPLPPPQLHLCRGPIELVHEYKQAYWTCHISRAFMGSTYRHYQHKDKRGYIFALQAALQAISPRWNFYKAIIITTTSGICSAGLESILDQRHIKTRKWAKLCGKSSWNLNVTNFWTEWIHQHYRIKDSMFNIL